MGARAGDHARTPNRANIACVGSLLVATPADYFAVPAMEEADQILIFNLRQAGW